MELVRDAVGVNVAVLVDASYAVEPATFAPADVFSVMVSVDAVMALSNTAVTFVVAETPVALAAGVLVVTDGGAVSDVVKLQVFGEAITTPASLLAETLALKVVEPASAADGVNVAFLSVAL